MDKKLKKQLKALYSPPEPLRKDIFLKKYRRREISIMRFYLIQIGYIQPYVWIISGVLFFILVVISSNADSSIIWLMSSFTPIIAITALTENHKSTIYKMNELEAATRFSLKSVIAVRMSIVGIFHLILLTVLALLSKDVSSEYAMVYMLVPYLITANISSIICRYIHGSEAVYGCMITAVLTSSVCFISKIQFEYIFTVKYFTAWVIVLFASLIFI